MFDDAIEVLKSNIAGNKNTGIPAIAQDYCQKIDSAIRVLENFPEREERRVAQDELLVIQHELLEKWNPLIEAAGKVDKARALTHFGNIAWVCHHNPVELCLICFEIQTILSSLPNDPEDNMAELERLDGRMRDEQLDAALPEKEQHEC